MIYAFSAVSTTKVMLCSFSAVGKNTMLICPVAGNVSFYSLVKMVSDMFLNLMINKCVLIISICGEIL